MTTDPNEDMELLKDNEILLFVKRAVMIKSCDGSIQGGLRLDIETRLRFFQSMKKPEKIKHNLKCKDFFGKETKNEFLKMLHGHASKMGCEGNGKVELQKFGQQLRENGKNARISQIQARFNEYLQSGMCHLCQIKWFEQDDE